MNNPPPEPEPPEPFVPYSVVHHDPHDPDIYQAIHIGTEAAADFDLADIILTSYLPAALLHAGFRSVQFQPRVWEFTAERSGEDWMEFERRTRG